MLLTRTGACRFPQEGTLGKENQRFSEPMGSPDGSTQQKRIGKCLSFFAGEP